LTRSGCYRSFKPVLLLKLWAGIAHLATGWTVRWSNPGGGEMFRSCPDRPWGPPSLLCNGYRVFPGGKAAGEWRWPPTLIYRRGWKKSRTIPLLLLWLFMACSRVKLCLPCVYTECCWANSFVFSNNDDDDVGVQKENNNYNSNITIVKYMALVTLWRIKKSWCDMHCRLADISSCCIHIYFGRSVPLKPARKPGALREFSCGSSWTNLISSSLRH